MIKKSKFIWLNGDIIPWNDARIGVMTHSLHYGSSVFEGERSYNGNIFKSEKHAHRLKNSAKILTFDIPYSEKEIIKAKKNILFANELDKFPDVYVRPVAWHEEGWLGVGAGNSKVSLAIGVWRWKTSILSRSSPISLLLSKWRRPPADTSPYDAKTTAPYVIGMMSKNIAAKFGFDDALLLDYRGFVAEAPGANIFIVNYKNEYNRISDSDEYKYMERNNENYKNYNNEECNYNNKKCNYDEHYNDKFCDIDNEKNNNQNIYKKIKNNINKNNIDKNQKIEICTPIADCFLNGITRQTVFEIAKENNILCVEKRITYEDLLNADEVFLTGSALEIFPVGNVNNDKIWHKCGDITAFLIYKYREKVGCPLNEIEENNLKNLLGIF